MSGRLLLTSVLFGSSFLITLWVLPGRSGSSEVVIDPGQIAFGVLEPSEPAERTISLANHCGEALDLRVSVDCSCLSVAPLQASVPASSAIEISVRPTGPEAGAREGPWLEIDRAIEIFAQGATLRYRDSIPVSARYFSPLQVNPNGLRRTLGVWTAKPWEVSYTAVDMYRPADLRVDADFIADAELVWNEKFRAGTIKLVPQSHLAPGTARGLLSLVVDDPTDSLPEQEVHYPLEIFGAMPYRIKPSVVDFSGVSANSGAERSTFVEATSQAGTVQIAAPVSDDGQVIAQVDPEQPARLLLRLRPNAGETPAAVSLRRTRVKFDVIATRPTGETAVFSDSALVLW